MTYNNFKRSVNALVVKAGGGIRVAFSDDPEENRFFANCSDGTVIVGNKACLRVEVRWGNGNHSGIVAI